MYTRIQYSLEYLCLVFMIPLFGTVYRSTSYLLTYILVFVSTCSRITGPSIIPCNDHLPINFCLLYILHTYQHDIVEFEVIQRTINFGSFLAHMVVKASSSSVNTSIFCCCSRRFTYGKFLVMFRITDISS